MKSRDPDGDFHRSSKILSGDYMNITTSQDSTVQLKISEFRFAMQDWSDFKMFSLDTRRL